ncbi:50S ribosomal protein L3 [Patescibacteria group bacterium]|nr:50S ribosomal protein L3 [Patescibacteria group bacterium]MBU1016426.1 50S ribosomal protein L3 [Patescibacteria group bacterium]MBU1684924.1 50S ribosomal protein L3 [Patescibacteria group bacterium]MBU1939048.1 50S ribosomal protein L3 [Patescibacteria group bacterium]
MPGIIGKKLGMSQVIQDDGRVIPVTYVVCEPNEVVQIKTEKTDGYPAIVLGFDAYKSRQGETRNKKFKVIKEFRVENADDYKKGQKVSVEILKEVETVTVMGNSRGKGYQGVMKRHNFAGGPESHGSVFHREPGSVGTCAKPGRVRKGRKLPGQMGNEQITLKNRPLISVVADKNVLAIKGAVPGANNSYVYIKF